MSKGSRNRTQDYERARNAPIWGKMTKHRCKHEVTVFKYEKTVKANVGKCDKCKRMCWVGKADKSGKWKILG